MNQHNFETMAMNADNDKYQISRWLAEFSDPEVEQSFQTRIQPIIIRQLRIALMVWGALLMLFAVPDYISLGPSRLFYGLLSYRVVITMALFILFFMITPETNFFRISNFVTALVIAGLTGFMLFFIYRQDVLYITIAVMMLQLIALLIFLPIRFVMSFFAAAYGVAITLLTRAAMGSPKSSLIVLFVLLITPVVIGAATAMRLGVLQRRQFTLLSQTEKINLELQKALSDNKQLSGLLPICASCKKIRDDKGYWNQIESYIGEHSDAQFSHGICPECARRLYPNFYKEE